MSTGLKIAWAFAVLTALMVPVNLVLYLFARNPLSLLATVVAAVVSLVCGLTNLHTTRLQRRRFRR